jgi:hypothetical protein
LRKDQPRVNPVSGPFTSNRTSISASPCDAAFRPRSQFEPDDRPLRLIPSSPLGASPCAFALQEGAIGGVVVLASCFGVYLVLALGFHWFLQPMVVKNSEATASKLPPATFVAYPDRRRAEPATSGEFLRSAPPAPAGELAKAEASAKPEQAAPVQARTPKPPKVAAPRSRANEGPYAAYSGNRPF